MTDHGRLSDPVRTASTLPTGSAIILRDYDMKCREALGRELMILCRRRRFQLLVAGDWRLAWKLDAHGVHLPEWQLRRMMTWKPKPGWLITAAAHSQDALVLAAKQGAHAALLSPVFQTTSHLGVRAMGPLRFAREIRQAPLPIYGLGGITSSNVKRLKLSGAVGISGITGFAG